jgi:hypothetical protein
VISARPTPIVTRLRILRWEHIGFAIRSRPQAAACGR